jgi:hypothetical protein
MNFSIEKVKESNYERPWFLLTSGAEIEKTM